MDNRYINNYPLDPLREFLNRQVLPVYAGYYEGSESAQERLRRQLMDRALIASRDMVCK